MNKTLCFFILTFITALQIFLISITVLYIYQVTHIKWLPATISESWKSDCKKIIIYVPNYVKSFLTRKKIIRLVPRQCNKIHFRWSPLLKNLKWKTATEPTRCGKKNTGSRSSYHRTIKIKNCNIQTQSLRHRTYQIINHHAMQYKFHRIKWYWEHYLKW